MIANANHAQATVLNDRIRQIAPVLHSRVGARSSPAGQSPLPLTHAPINKPLASGYRLLARFNVCSSPAQTCRKTGPKLFPRAFPREFAKPFRTFPFPAVEPTEMLRLGP